jgi:hypothetical protein
MQVVASSAVVAAGYIDAGIVYFRRNDFASAITAFEAALRYAPGNPYAHWNLATALLSTGNYARGFTEFEWMWLLFKLPGGFHDRLEDLPLWDGERHVRLALYSQLGHGDAIMALRYLPALKRRAKVTLIVDRALKRLAQAFDVEVLTEVPDDLSRFDAKLSLFSAMRVLGESVESIPAAPYIATPLRPRPGHVGIAWSGKTQTEFSLEAFLSRFDHRGFTLHSLQPHHTRGLRNPECEPLPEPCDFVDVADRIATMQHVVTVDTAAVHLASAMGHPSVHLVLPFLSDWRWWHTTAWYPRLNTYRQSAPGDWSQPFAQLNARLH